MNTQDHNVSDTERDSANAEGKRNVRNSNAKANERYQRDCTGLFGLSMDNSYRLVALLYLVAGVLSVLLLIYDIVSVHK